MKIVLNSLVPLDRREDVERVVMKHAIHAVIHWRSGPSTKVVLEIHVEATTPDERFLGSIFESPLTGEKAVAAVTDFLEERISVAMSSSGR